MQYSYNIPTSRNLSRNLRGGFNIETNKLLTTGALFVLQHIGMFVYLMYSCKRMKMWNYIGSNCTNLLLKQMYWYSFATYIKLLCSVRLSYVHVK